MKKQELKVGDLVQLNPETVINESFSACFMVVIALRAWGVQGYVTVPGKGQAYYRATWDEMELIGRAIWLLI